MDSKGGGYVDSPDWKKKKKKKNKKKNKNKQKQKKKKKKRKYIVVKKNAEAFVLSKLTEGKKGAFRSKK